MHLLHRSSGGAAHNPSVNFIVRIQPSRMTPTIRFFRSSVALLLCAIALLACANPLVTSVTQRRFTLPEAQLQQALARRFPVEQRVADLLDVRLSSPRLSLLPASNRLGTELALNLAERLRGTRYDGSVALEYGLRFDSSDQSIRLADVRVSRFSLGGMPAPYQELLGRYVPRLAERWLEGYVLHQFTEQDLGWVGSLGLEPAALQVTSAGLSVALQPKTEKTERAEKPAK